MLLTWILLAHWRTAGMSDVAVLRLTDVMVTDVTHLLLSTDDADASGESKFDRPIACLVPLALARLTESLSDFWLHPPRSHGSMSQDP